MRSWKPACGVLVILATALALAGCDASAGVGLGVSYPNAYGSYGGSAGWGTGVWIGGPPYSPYSF